MQKVVEDLKVRIKSYLCPDACLRTSCMCWTTSRLQVVYHFFPDQHPSTEPNQCCHLVDFPSHAWDRCASPSLRRALECIQSYSSCQLFTRATNQSCSGCSVADVAATQRIRHAQQPWPDTWDGPNSNCTKINRNNSCIAATEPNYKIYYKIVQACLTGVCEPVFHLFLFCFHRTCHMFQGDVDLAKLWKQPQLRIYLDMQLSFQIHLGMNGLPQILIANTLCLRDGHSMVDRRFGSSPINPGVFNTSVPQHAQHVLRMLRYGRCSLCRWCSLCTPESARQTKIWDNYLYFHYGKDRVQSVQLIETSNSITNGQPYEGVSSVDGYTLDVKAGYHGSSEVADHFNAGLNSHNALGLYTWAAPLPSELNFAVFGTLFVTIGSTRDCIWREGRKGTSEVHFEDSTLPCNPPLVDCTAKCYLQSGLLKCPCGLPPKAKVTNVTFSGNKQDDLDVSFE